MASTPRLTKRAVLLSPEALGPQRLAVPSGVVDPLDRSETLRTEVLVPSLAALAPSPYKGLEPRLTLERLAWLGLFDRVARYRALARESEFLAEAEAVFVQAAYASALAVSRTGALPDEPLDAPPTEPPSAPINVELPGAPSDRSPVDPQAPVVNLAFTSRGILVHRGGVLAHVSLEGRRWASLPLGPATLVASSSAEDRVLVDHSDGALRLCAYDARDDRFTTDLTGLPEVLAPVACASVELVRWKSARVRMLPNPNDAGEHVPVETSPCGALGWLAVRPADDLLGVFELATGMTLLRPDCDAAVAPSRRRARTSVDPTARALALRGDRTPLLAYGARVYAGAALLSTLSFEPLRSRFSRDGSRFAAATHEALTLYNVTENGLRACGELRLSSLDDARAS